MAVEQVDARAFLDGGAAPRDMLLVATEEPKLPRHRRSAYTIEIAQAFCEKIADGMSLRKICELDEFPAKSTIFLWMAQHIEFQVMYCAALHWKSSMRADELIEIADDASDDWKAEAVDPSNPESPKVMVFNVKALNRAKLMIDTRKWIISKEYPERYGDRLAQVLPPTKGGEPGDDAKLIGVGMAIDAHPLKDAITAWKDKSGRAAGVIAG